MGKRISVLLYIFSQHGNDVLLEMIITVKSYKLKRLNKLNQSNVAAFTEKDVRG